MGISMLNLISFAVSLAATVLLFRVVGMMAGGQLRKGYLLIAIGILLSVTVHSLAEFLEAYGLLGQNLLFAIMPILVLIGSIFFIAAGIATIKALKG